MPACTHRSICRGAAPASCLGPLAFSVVTSEAAAKHCFRCAQRSISISAAEPVNFHATQRTGPTSSPLASVSPLALQVYRCLDWLPSSVAHDFCNPEDPDALDDDSSFFAVTQQQWRASVRRMLRCRLGLRIAIFFPGCEGRKS